MRVIAGSARRTQLKTLEGMDTRPTTDRIKETLFNMIAPYLYDSIFLDLFAGSGAIGIEALSRGASFAAFNDMSRDAVKVIRANIEKLGFEQKSVVMNVDFAQAIRSLSARRFDIVFLDPPYRSGLMEKALRELSSAGILNDGAMVIAEHDAHIAPVDTGALVLYDRRIYRDTALSFYRLEGEE